MFNYRGIVTELVNSKSAIIEYSVLVPVFQTQQVIKAYVVSQKGIIPIYKQGDVVIVAELEPTEYFILGMLQEKSSNKLAFIGTESILADNGVLNTAISLKEGRTGAILTSTGETLGTLVNAKKQLTLEVLDLQREVKVLQGQMHELLSKK